MLELLFLLIKILAVIYIGIFILILPLYIIYLVFFDMESAYSVRVFNSSFATVTWILYIYILTLILSDIGITVAIG